MSQPSIPPVRTPISKEAAIKALWQKGVISWKLDKNQKEMHDMVRNSPHKILVFGCSRQNGKSFAMVCIAIETCIQTPYQIVKLIAPKVKDIRRILAPLIRDICSDAPKEQRPIFKSQESVFRFPNGSEIQLAGTDNGHADSIRGTKAHLCIIDEAGFCDDLDYVVNSILLPTTTMTGGKIIMASTPSKAPDHPFILFLRQAELEGRYIKKTIYDNPRLTEADIDALAIAAGGKSSVNFRREYLVEIITSEDDAVVPEFTKEIQEKIIKEVPIPSHYDSYVSMDIGGRDLTAVILGYYDFANAKLIIQDEVIMGHKMTSDSLALAVKEKELALWKGKPTFLRVSDNNNIIFLNDLSIKHQLHFIPTLKDNFDAALNNMRMLIKSERIIIHPRCKTLIYHLEAAIWNKSRTSFSRAADKGHFDALAALIYLCRNINFNKNPFPPGFLPGAHDVFFTDKPNEPKTEFERAMVNQFKVNKIVKVRGR